MTPVDSPGTVTTVDAAWDVLNTAYIELYAVVLHQTPTVNWQANAYTTSTCLLSGYAYFPRAERPDTEALVISVHIQRTDGVVQWTSDACMDSGPILAIGPSRTEPDSTPLASWIGVALDETIAWLRAETPHLIAYLNQGPTPYDVG